MTYVNVAPGAYKARSIIASDQRVLNLYMETTPQAAGEPLQFILYPTPGLSLIRAQQEDGCRCLYRASNGDLYSCYGQSVYYVASTGIATLIGTFVPSAPSDATPRTTPVSISDNGTDAIVVDGSIDGWKWNLQSRSGWTRIIEDGFYGGDFVTYLDTFFILNKPGTQIFYVSGSNATTFDPLDFASKSTDPDNLVRVLSIHSVLIMVGTYSWESWQSTGGDGTSAGSFPFSRLPGNYGNWGCVAPYSIAATNNTVFWLSQDASGRGMVVQGDGYTSKRISTHAIEAEFSAYPVIDDATAYCYQQQGHIFYVLNFPSARGDRGATWVYDLNENEWHERNWIDENGIEWRHRGSFATEAYGLNMVGDWQNTNLYYFDLNNFTDNTQPVQRLVHFPHQIDKDGNKRVMYHQCIANFQTGSDSAGGSGPPITIIETDFMADDGTLLQAYSNTADIGATFTKDSGINAQIVSDAVISTGSGASLYTAAGTPTQPDYTLSYNVELSTYAVMPPNGSTMFAIARANGSDNGYKAQVSSNGSALSVSLIVMPSGSPATVALGTLASGHYRVSLTLVSTSISVFVYRSADGLWLTPDATWSGIRTSAIQITNSTFTLPGNVLIGGNWIGE